MTDTSRLATRDDVAGLKYEISSLARQIDQRIQEIDRRFQRMEDRHQARLDRWLTALVWLPAGILVFLLTLIIAGVSNSG